VTATTPNTKNQHYVWRHYLAAWAKSGTFFCFRHKDQKLFPTQPKAVASETYFYEARQLTAADMEYLEIFISGMKDERLRELNRDYLKLTQRSFEMREHLKRTDLIERVRVALDEQLRWAERNLGERYHADIENKCQDILNALRCENADFYNDMIRAGDFIYYLCLQYFRTAKMRHGFGRLPSLISGHDPQRTAGALLHMCATAVSVSVFKEKRNYRIVFLKNDTAIPFITGDQPVLNMLDPKTTDDIELYYPLSPRLAMVLTKNAVKFPHSGRRVSQFEVESHNYAIYSGSEDQVYSDNEVYLRSLVTLGKHLLSA
jgi:hypothetical protein